jgi:hypothetical protein
MEQCSAHLLPFLLSFCSFLFHLDLVDLSLYAKRQIRPARIASFNTVAVSITNVRAQYIYFIINLKITQRFHFPPRLLFVLRRSRGWLDAFPHTRRFTPTKCSSNFHRSTIKGAYKVNIHRRTRRPGYPTKCKKNNPLNLYGIYYTTQASLGDSICSRNASMKRATSAASATVDEGLRPCSHLFRFDLSLTQQ